MDRLIRPVPVSGDPLSGARYVAQSIKEVAKLGLMTAPAPATLCKGVYHVQCHLTVDSKRGDNNANPTGQSSTLYYKLFFKTKTGR